MSRPSTTSTPAWALRAWPPLLWQSGSESSLRLRHVETRVTNPGDQIMRTAGQTMWAARAGAGEAGVAWDWIQLSRGVVAMADPLSVVTNLRLLGPEGELLTMQQAMIRLNLMVNELPWQCEVQRALSQTAAALVTSAVPVEAFG